MITLRIGVNERDVGKTYHRQRDKQFVTSKFPALS